MRDSLKLLLFACVASFPVVFCTCSLVAQENNSWNGPTNGDWESLNWSLGTWPGTNQSILITNAGTKIVSIGTNTVINYPQTLNIESLSLSSPANTTNALLMDHVGLATPLVIGMTNEGSLNIANGNSIFEMHSSKLVVYGGINLSGTFIESDGSQISADGLNMNGIFNLTNSTLTVTGTETLSDYPANFRQWSGTNIMSGLSVANSTEYDLQDGYFSGTVNLNYATFKQTGGQFFGTVDFGYWGGTFQFAGGLISENGFSVQGMRGGSYMQYATGDIFVQTGGTMLTGNLNVGMDGYGEYTLSGGLLVSSNLNVGPPEEWEWERTTGAPTYFAQSGGVHSNSTITLAGAVLNLVPFYDVAKIILDPNSGKLYGASTYTMSGGMLYTSAINLNYADFNQIGGTNQVGTISGATYSLNGGLLLAQTLQNGGFNQSAGIAQAGNLTNEDVTLSGGQLLAQNVSLVGNTFQHLGGTFTISGPLTLDNGTWQEGTNGLQLGQLLLGAGTNSNLLFPTNACVLQFANSSSLNWSNSGALVIQGWNGSLTGGGQHQILFGNSPGTLTAQQLSQIEFYNPGGLDLWTYHAKMLATGEIVPDPHAPFPGPSPIASMSFLMSITNGISAADGKGYFLFVASDSGSNYNLIGIHNVENSSGIYSYGRPTASNGVAMLMDSSGVTGQLSVGFNNAGQGEFDLTAITPPGEPEGGLFQAMASPGPLLLAERDFVFTVSDGSAPFATSGSYSLVTSVSGNTYAIGGTSTGTYSPSPINQSTAVLQMNDSVTGPGTLYLSFSTLVGWHTEGTFAIVQTNGGFQIGSFFANDNSPFFSGSPALTNDWYYLPSGNGAYFGYYMLAEFPYIYHEDMGWEFFWDANNSARGGFFYDFADGVWFYSDPSLFPYLYDYNLNAWMYYSPQTGSKDRYTSNPRWFYNFSTQTWGNHL